MNTEYKDREPIITSKIIKEFFEKSGYSIELTDEHKTEVGTYYATCNLSIGSVQVLSTCGKGSSKAFCEASAYAEMYERVANKSALYTDIDLVHQFEEMNYKKSGYYLDENEKTIDIKDFLSYSYVSDSTACIRQLAPTSDLSLEYTNLRFGKLVGIPYISLTDSENLLINPVALVQTYGSNGMAAGNTMSEALVQAISEIFERESICRFEQDKNETFYYIPVENIQNKNILGIIQRVENCGNKVLILDLSYTTKLPAVCVILYSPFYKNYMCSFGSHPVFDIALERCLTELYQGRESLEINSFCNKNPYKAFIENHHQGLLHYTESAGGQWCINNCYEKCFLNAVKADKCSDVFIKNPEDNHQMLNWLCHIAGRERIRLYYKDNSICEGMCAVHVYSPDIKNVNSFSQRPSQTDVIYSEIGKYKEFHKIFESYSLSPIFKLTFSHFTSYPKKRMNMLILETLSRFYQRQLPDHDYADIYSSLYELLPEYRDVIAPVASAAFYKGNKYTFEETKKLYEFYGGELLEDLWDNCLNFRWFCEKILEPAYRRIYSAEFYKKAFSIYN